MKKLLFALVFVMLFAGLYAQAPQGISHQAVIRNAANELLANQTIGIQVSILQGSVEGPAVYVETHQPMSNAQGLITYVIGQGNPVSGTFAQIDWADGLYFLKTEADPAGGTNYTITGTTQFLSVPYALHAKIVEIESDPRVPQGTQIGEIQYWNGTAWEIVAPGTTGQILTFVYGVPTWYGTGAGSNDVWNSATGKIWMDRNLGAIEVATSSTDADAYGDLYQWGRLTDGHQVRTSGTTSTLSSSNTPGHGNFIIVNDNPHDWRSPQNDNLWQGVSGVNNPCPSGYRLPTEAEWETERISWSNNNAAGAFASPLKLPAAGGRNLIDGLPLNVGSNGLYWSSTVFGIGAQYLFFFSSSATTNGTTRAYGFAVRCIKD